MLVLDGLSVGYRGPRGTVLEQLRLSAGAGEFVCILGRNGAGKSTLMRTIAGLQPPLAGTALLEGEPVALMRPGARAQRIAVVLTERAFSPGLTVEDVVSLGRQPFTRWQGHLTTQDLVWCDRALEMAGAVGFRNLYFEDLSDGERQRVLIARAIAQTPKLMVLDEITAFLDLPGRVEVMALLRLHARQTKSVVLLSSHDLDLSLRLADRVWLLDGRGGMVVDVPERLMSEGHIGRAFDTDAVRFSSNLGRFEINS